MGYDFIRGPELVEKFQYQLIHSHYIDHLINEVERVEVVEGGFDVTTLELVRYFAKTVIVATGMTRRKLDVPGEETFQRRGVFYGNIQDFSFVEDAPVAVIGGGNSALQMVENLHSVAGQIHLISLGQLTGNPAIVERVKCFENFYIHEDYRVLEMTGYGSLAGITIRKTGEKETKNIPVRGVFISIGFQPNTFSVSHLVNSNERGEIIIGPDCSTSCPGLFAAGDVTNAFGKRIIIASGEVAKAALAARQYLLGRGKACT
jgi:thioredoxin reductase